MSKKATERKGYTELQLRRANYDALAYYAGQAELALSQGRFEDHLYWAKRYHSLRSLLEGSVEVEAFETLLGVAF